MIKIWGPRPDPSPNFPGALAQAGLAPPPRSLLHVRHLPSALSEAGPALCRLALSASYQRACSPDTCSTARSTASPQPSWLSSCPLRAVTSSGSGLLGAGPPCLTWPPREAGLSTPLCEWLPCLAQAPCSTPQCLGLSSPSCFLKSSHGHLQSQGGHW